jgi:hypothetical protein
MKRLNKTLLFLMLCRIWQEFHKSKDLEFYEPIGV